MNPLYAGFHKSLGSALPSTPHGERALGVGFGYGKGYGVVGNVFTIMMIALFIIMMTALFIIMMTAIFIIMMIALFITAGSVCFALIGLTHNTPVFVFSTEVLGRYESTVTLSVLPPRGVFSLASQFCF